MNNFSYTAEKEDAGTRIDKFLSVKLQDFTRSRIQNLIDSGDVLVNGVSVSKNYKLKDSETVTVSLNEAVETDVIPQNIPIDIVYEDEDILVINKRKGMVVHPANGNWENTLVNALLFHCAGSLSGINGVLRPGIVHRIDKDTSGLLVVAKNDVAHQGLADQIKEHRVERVYHAIVYGHLKEQIGTVCAPIGRDKKDRKKMAVTPFNSKEATTHYEVLEDLNGFSHLRLKLETGRTHQIRVHMAYKGHAVAGDAVYGPKKVITELEGQCLHAKEISFCHPRTNEHMTFSTELPEYFVDFLNKHKF